MAAPSFSPRFFRDLVESIEWSRKQLSSFTRKRLDILRQYVGRHYGGAGACRERVPQNYIRMQVSIYTRHLVSRRPQCLIETWDPRLRSLANASQTWANDRFPQIGFEKILQRWAMDALVYPVGMIKVCAGYVPGYDSMGEDLGQPYADVVDPERSVYDMAATSWKKLDYIGHRYTAAKEDLRGPGFDAAAVAELVPDPHSSINEQGEEKTESLAQDGDFNFDRLRDYIDCWEIYLPRENVLVTFPVVGQQIHHVPIRIEKFLGPMTDLNCGPFHILGFDEVPGNLMPSPPVHAIYDLHEAVNRIARKLLRQSDRQKTILGVQQNVAGEAGKVINAKDGDTVPLSHPEAFREIRFGGPDQANMAHMLALKQLTSFFGGNFDALGGLGPQSGTLGQDQLLASASSKLVQFMQDETVSRTAELMRGMLWYDWHSRRQLEYAMPIEGMPGQSLPWSIQPEQRYGGGDSRFGRMQFKVHPYSMRPVSPEMRMQQWMQLYLQIILPSMPALTQQGVTVDVMAFVRKLAQHMSLTDLDDVLKTVPVDPAMMEAMGGGGGMEGGAGGAGKPNGQYTRTNVSQNPDEAQAQEVLRLMNTGDAA